MKNEFKNGKSLNHEYFNFSIEKMEEAMKGKPETMPKLETFEDLEQWLNRGDKNE